MIVSRITLDCDKIQDWPSFHDEFASVLGFADFYGRNMNAWIDCMTSLDAPDDAMSQIHCEKGSVLVLELEHMRKFKERCPEQYNALIECSAFVNWRRLETHEAAVLALSFNE